jgi:nitrite reductase/ring-hydroxylating ferredoxin subunit
MTSNDLSRRALLGGVAVGTGGLALAACGTSSGSSGAAAPPSGDPTTASPAGGAGTPLAAESDVAVGSGVIVSAESVVVTQPVAGEFHAFSSVCTHRSCQVAEVVDDEIICTCHGSRFSATDGSVVNGPATAPLAEFPIDVADGQITLA